MDRKFRVGVVGVGHLGQHHARVFAESAGADLVFVCDTDAAQARRIAQTYGAKATQDFHDLIGKVDAVSIVTPTVTHYEIAHAMLENGIHCLVEKPICNTVMDAARLSILSALM